MICLILMSFLLITNISIAQTKLTLLYKTGKIKGDVKDYVKPNNPTKWSGKFSIDEFTINDSITFYETAENYDEKDEYTLKALKKARKNKIPGKNFMVGATYCNYASGIYIDEIEWKDDTYLVKDNIKNKQKAWLFADESKHVLGYPCKQAYIQNGEDVEMVAWYTTNFKCNYSNTGDTTIPGTILEIYNTKTGILSTAIDLQIETSPILMPLKGGALVTKDAFDKIKKNKKS